MKKNKLVGELLYNYTTDSVGLITNCDIDGRYTVEWSWGIIEDGVSPEIIDIFLRETEKKMKEVVVDTG